MPRDLDSFLHGDKDGKSETEKAGHIVKSGENFTHRLFTEKRTGYFINEDDYEEFLTLYCEELSNMNKQYLTEKGTEIGQLRVDLDFKHEGEVHKNLYTREQVIEFAKVYMATVGDYLEVPEQVELYVLEKTRPTFDKVKNISRSGVHIQVPGLKTHAEIELQIRRDMMGVLAGIFGDLPVKNVTEDKNGKKDWSDVYDKSVIARTQPWPVLGSRKGILDGSQPYMIRYILDWDRETGDIGVDTDVPKVITPDLVRKFSIRSKADEETPPTEKGAQIPKKATAEHARSVSRGRPLERGAPGGSRGSSPGRGVYMAPLPETYRDYIAKHVMNLSENRYDGDHNSWVQVGQCLKNIHHDLEDVFLDFMAQSTKRDQNKARVSWNGFVFRVEGDRLGIGSLRKWSKEDNYEGYLAIEAGNVDRLVDEAALTQTEYDFAQVIKAKYQDEFKCANYRQNEWYQYSTHIWKQTEQGVELQKRLSSDVAKLFADKETAMLANITALGDCKHSAKESDPSCHTCQAEEKKKMYSAARLKLRRTGFKDSVMKECRVLFYDKEFAKKIDDNKHLIAFNNGVYDTLTQTFRDGHPDDYISFCTKIDYALDTQYHRYKCWGEIDRFLRNILPTASVREYFLKHLATCLSGVFTQRFHILTGSGSNGKSMLMNLCATAFGDYCYKANIAMFTQKRGKAGAAAPELVRMRGKRFVFMSEPDEGEPLSTGFMKEMTSSEKVTGRDLFAGSKDIVEFDVQAKCHLACNDKPKVNSNDGGTWRRLKVIDFPMKFVTDPKLPNELPMDESIMHKVLSQEWAECFMAYLVHLHRDGKGLAKLSPPKEVEAYTNEYKEESDVIARFIREYVHDVATVVGDPEAPAPEPVSWNGVAQTFQTWKRENELANRGSATELQKRLISQFGKMPKGGWVSFRFGPA